VCVCVCVCVCVFVCVYVCVALLHIALQRFQSKKKNALKWERVCKERERKIWGTFRK
jgi:hypothetical protein